ncbi:MAG: TetR family transcriptional regulator [Rhizomicrobium sp.]
MAKRAPSEAQKDVARVWQQRSTRAAILEAARRLAARNGAAELTLARVADEADFSPNTVYAYFVNKSELMLAVVADDLAAIARAMRDVYPANEDVETEKAAETPEEPARDECEAPEASAEVAPEVHDTIEQQPALEADACSDQSVEAEHAAVQTLEPADETATLAENSEEQHVEISPPESVPEAASDLELRNRADVALGSWERTEDVVEEHGEPAAVVEERSTSLSELAAATPDAPESPVEPVEHIEVPAPSVEESAPGCAETSPAQALCEAAVEVVEDRSVAAVSDEEGAAPTAESDVPSSEEPETADVAEARAEPQTGSRPARMPIVEKKWSSQSEPERDDDIASALAQLQESVAKLEARPVDAWLERRLRELERMIASLEERQGNSERSSGTVSGLVEESVRDLHGRLEAVEKNQQSSFDGNTKTFGARVDASEKRLREMLAELRNLTMLSSSRLDVLERDANRHTAFEDMGAAPAVESPADTIEQSQTAAPIENADATVENSSTQIAETSYLSQARRSAMAAAAQTVAQPSEPMQRFASTMSSIKTACVAAPHGLHARARPSPTMAPQIRLASLAGRGNADAELLLGLEYLDGTGAAKNESEAAQWIARSAARGDAVAQFWLGNLYANGRGLKTDPALAMHWYEEAAMQGNRKAMHQLAVSYAEGWGATRNYAEASRWFSRAASLGYVDSAFNLGVLYERGLGMPQSLLDAYKWYSIASAMGDKGSPPRLAVLKTQMTDDDVTAATQAANSFAPDALDQTANTTPRISQLPKS